LRSKHNIRRLIEVAEIKNIINSETLPEYDKQLLKKIVMYAIQFQDNFKDRNNYEVYEKRRNLTRYASITTKEYFVLIYKKEYNSEIINHDKWMTKLVKHLEMLSSDYASMYNNKNNLFDRHVLKNGDNAYFYRGKYNDGWNRLGYFYLDLGTMFVDIKNLDHDIDTKVLVSLIAITLNNTRNEHNFIFTYNQLKVLFNISPKQFKDACKMLGYEYNIKYDKLSNSERKLYEVYSDSDTMRGMFFEDDVVAKAWQYLEQFNMNLEFRNIFSLRQFFYQNMQRVDKDYFLDIPALAKTVAGDMVLDKSIWSLSIFNSLCDKQSVQNQVNSYYTDNESVNHKGTEKSAKFSTLHNTHGVHNKKTYDHDKKQAKIKKIVNSFDVESYLDGTLETSPVESNETLEYQVIAYDKINRSADFGDFCANVRELYQKLKEERCTQRVMFEIKNKILAKCNNSIFITELKKCDTLVSVFKSPIFNAEYNKYLDCTPELINGYYTLAEIDLEKKLNVDCISDMELSMIINPIQSDFGNMDEYIHDEFNISIMDAVSDVKMSNVQQEYVESVIKKMFDTKSSYDLLKVMAEKKSKITVQHIIQLISNNNYYETIKELRVATLRMKTSNPSFSNHFNAILNEIDGRVPSTEIKKYIAAETKPELNYFAVNTINYEFLELNTKVFNIILEENNSRQEILKTVDEDEKLILDKCLELGITPGQRGLSMKRFEGFVLEFQMGMTTMPEIVKELILG